MLVRLPHNIRAGDEVFCALPGGGAVKIVIQEGQRGGETVRLRNIGDESGPPLLAEAPASYHRVVVPFNVMPGDELTCAKPGGGAIACIVPEWARAGDILNVLVRRDECEYEYESDGAGGAEHSGSYHDEDSGPAMTPPDSPPPGFAPAAFAPVAAPSHRGRELRPEEEAAALSRRDPSTWKPQQPVEERAILRLLRDEPRCTGMKASEAELDEAAAVVQAAARLAPLDARSTWKQQVEAGGCGSGCDCCK